MRKETKTKREKGTDNYPSLLTTVSRSFLGRPIENSHMLKFHAEIEYNARRGEHRAREERPEGERSKNPPLSTEANQGPALVAFTHTPSLYSTVQTWYGLLR